MSGLTHNVSAQANELLDHIYEYGTNSEGVISRINSLCDAAVEQLRAELAACRAAGEAAGYAQGLSEAGRDAERYRFITGDHVDSDVRRAVAAVCDAIVIRGKGATDAAIDALRREVK